MKLNIWQRYGLFGVWAGLHLVALLFSPFLAKGLALVDLVILFFVLPLTPSLPLPEMQIGHTEDRSEELTLTLLEYLREIESNFHQRLDGLEGMLEENTMLTKIRRRGKANLTLVPSAQEDTHPDATEPSEHA